MKKLMAVLSMGVFAASLAFAAPATTTKTTKSTKTTMSMTKKTAKTGTMTTKKGSKKIQTQTQNKQTTK